MSSCLGAHGFEGYNQLTQLIRPHLELRGFYFGVRSALYRICIPEDYNDTSYLHLREVEVNKNGNVVSVDYSPIKKQKLTSVKYNADTRNSLLEPLKVPRSGGDEELKGFFNKSIFCPIILVFEDIIQSFSSINSEFPDKDLKCESNYKGILSRKIERKAENTLCTYSLLCGKNIDKNIPGENISFLIITPKS